MAVATEQVMPQVSPSQKQIWQASYRSDLVSAQFRICPVFQRFHDLRNLQASYTKSGHELETGPEDPKSASTLEEYVGELLSRIQPAAASEDRRETVAQYVQHVIAQAFQPAVEASFLPTVLLLRDDFDLAVLLLIRAKLVMVLRPSISSC